VRSIIVMAHNLGLQVIAEGVETPDHAAFLLAEGCDEVQGYLYAKPLANADFEAYLRSNRAGSGTPKIGGTDGRKPDAFKRRAG
jgi:EAL domain-containing protein (putative c-di-GMP-specific phosphodiesterase class I)